MQVDADISTHQIISLTQDEFLQAPGSPAILRSLGSAIVWWTRPSKVVIHVLIYIPLLRKPST